MTHCLIVCNVSDVQVVTDHYETHIESQPEYDAIVEPDNIYEEPAQVQNQNPTAGPYIIFCVDHQLTKYLMRCISEWNRLTGINVQRELILSVGI